MLQTYPEDAIKNKINEVSITIDKLQNENIVLEEACVNKDEEPLHIQLEKDQNLTNLPPLEKLHQL